MLDTKGVKKRKEQQMTKRLLLTAAVILFAQSLMAQDWSQNPTRPSLLLFAEGIAGPGRLERTGIYSHTGTTLGASFSAALELPASNNSNILLKLGVGRRQDDVLDN